MAQDAYHGAFPGKGEHRHRYLITVQALSVDKLPVPAEAGGAMVSWVAYNYTLAKRRSLADTVAERDSGNCRATLSRTIRIVQRTWNARRGLGDS